MLGSSPVASDAATRDGVTEARRQQSEETLYSQGRAQRRTAPTRQQMNVIVDGQHEAQKYHQRSVAAPPKQLSTAEERLHADELDACRGKATSVAARSVQASRIVGAGRQPSGQVLRASAAQGNTECTLERRRQDLSEQRWLHHPAPISFLSPSPAICRPDHRTRTAVANRIRPCLVHRSQNSNARRQWE